MSETYTQQAARSRAERLALERARIEKPEHNRAAFAKALDEVLSERPDLYTKAVGAPTPPDDNVTLAEELAEYDQREGESFADALDRTLSEDPDLYEVGGVRFRMPQ